MADPVDLEAEAGAVVAAVAEAAADLADLEVLVALAEDVPVAVVQEEVFNDSPKSI